MYNLSCIQRVIYMELENPEIDDDTANTLDR